MSIYTVLKCYGYENDRYFYFSIYVIFFAMLRLFSELLESYFKAFNMHFIPAFFQSLYYFFSIVGALFVFFYDLNLIQLLVLNFLFMFFVFLVEVVFFCFKSSLRPQLVSFNEFKLILKDLVPSSFWYLVSGLTFIVIFQTDSIVVSYFFGLATYSVYAIFFKGADMIRNVIGIFSNILFSDISKLQMEGRFLEIKAKHNRLLLITSLLSAASAIVFYLASPWFFSKWLDRSLGDEYSSLFSMLSIYIFLFSVNHVSGLFIGALGRHKKVVVFGVLQSIFNIVISVVLSIYINQVEVVIFATSISLVLTNLWFNLKYFYEVVK